MEIAYKRLVTGLVIVLELLSLYYVFPKTVSPRAASFEGILSRVCLNSENLFEANKRCAIIRAKLWGIDERVFMYYADRTPQKNKEYLICFGAPPSQQNFRYDPTVEFGEKVYLPRGLTWDVLIEQLDFAVEDYTRGDPAYVVRREPLRGIVPSGDFFMAVVGNKEGKIPRLVMKSLE
jgi:hypothetical protein